MNNITWEVTREFLTQKLTWILGGLLSFAIPITPFVKAIGMIMFVDILTRVACVIKKNGWGGVRSSKLFHSIPKFILYCGGIISGYALQTILPAVPAMQVAAYIIAIVEFKSVSENIDEYTGINIFEALKKYMNRRGIKDVSDTAKTNEELKEEEKSKKEVD